MLQGQHIFGDLPVKAVFTSFGGPTGERGQAHEHLEWMQASEADFPRPEQAFEDVVRVSDDSQRLICSQGRRKAGGMVRFRRQIDSEGFALKGVLETQKEFDIPVDHADRGLRENTSERRGVR